MSMYEYPMIEYLDRDRYDANVERQVLCKELWSDAKGRWGYHEAASRIIRQVPLSLPTQALEAGSIGAQLVRGSDTIDCKSMWHCVDAPTIDHDLRRMPWPIQASQYTLFTALRVWQHLWPVQKEALNEAFRIAEYVLIGAPEIYFQGRGIPRETFLEWTKNHTLLEEHHIHTGTVCNLYLWKR